MTFCLLGTGTKFCRNEFIRSCNHFVISVDKTLLKSSSQAIFFCYSHSNLPNFPLFHKRAYCSYSCQQRIHTIYMHSHPDVLKCLQMLLANIAEFKSDQISLKLSYYTKTDRSLVAIVPCNRKKVQICEIMSIGFTIKIQQCIKKSGGFR